VADGKLPVVDGRRVVRALTRSGFVTDRIVGSHDVMVFPGDGTRTVTVQSIRAATSKPGTLRSIIKQAGFNLEEFKALL
jgi:predicted RNA binding protein YcfA (HicA-like mRNA interferase family)